MARCEDCIHGEICERFAGLRTLVCGYKAEERCKMFKPTADVAAVVRCKDCKYKTEVAREIFEEIDKITLKYLDDKEYSTGDMVYDITELKNKYTNN